MAKLVSIHSFRGGTGKSNLTANLASYFAAQGNRVAIIDSDIQSPGVHVLFGFDEGKIDRSLNDFLWGDCQIEDAAYDVTQRLNNGTAGKVYLVPSSINASQIARVLREGYDVALLNDGVRRLMTKLDLDYLFIDTHPGINDETLLSIAMSDVLLVVLRPDQQDYQGTAVTVDVAKRLEVPRLWLVANKVHSDVDTDAFADELKRSYDVPVAGICPLSEDLLRLGSAGLFCVQNPDTPFADEVSRIAEQVMG